MTGRVTTVRSLFLTFLLAAASSSGGTPAGREILLSVTPGAEEVEIGKAFPLTVVRRWSRELLPGDFSEEQLSPLTVRLVETGRREEEQFVEETRRYQCYAFFLEDITIPAPAFRARSRDGGPERVVFGDPITIRVKPSLDPGSPGPVELPGGLLEERPAFPWRIWAGGAGAALAALALIGGYLRLRTLRARARRDGPAADPHRRALERLERLKAQRPESAPDIDAYHVEASSLVRDYIKERFAVGAPEMTTEQFLGAPRTAHVLKASHRTLLEDYLTRCDLVKFGRRLPAPPDLDRLLEGAERFLLETGHGGTGEAGASASLLGGGSS